MSISPRKSCLQEEEESICPDQWEQKPTLHFTCVIERRNKI